MKKQSVLLKSVVILALAIMGSACASKNDSGGSAPASSGAVNPQTPTPNTSGGGTTTGSTDIFAGSSGASVALDIDWNNSAHRSVVTTYVGSHPLNSPTNFRLLVDLTETNGRAGGTVKIGYKDNGQVYTGVFTTNNPTGYDTNRVSYKNWYVGKPNSEFNQWFTFEGKKVWHGFFQDAYGAIVVVIDGGLDLGDGGGVTEMTGRVYFKNFRTAPAPQYMGGYGEQCWFLLPPSPYECGTFKVGEYVSTTSALNPADGYTLLATFSGMSKSKAFH